MPALNLTPKQAEEYERRYRAAASLRDAAVESGDQDKAKRYRQVISRLRTEYEQMSRTNDSAAEHRTAVRAWSSEHVPLTLEQRVTRIEKHLGLD